MMIPPSRTSPLLAQSLAKNGTMHPQYGGGLSNHVSMALLALSSLGATSEQIRAYAETAFTKLEPLAGPELEIGASRWADHLGEAAAYRGYVRFFRHEIPTRGRADVLARVLPRLLPGLASAAFHCMIRTAYAARFGEDEELARGLAYWASHHLVLGLPEPRMTAASSPLERWQRIRRDGVLAGAPSSQRLIVDALLEVAQRPGFDRAADQSNGGAEALALLAEAALRVYVVSRSFTALHMVTATHAYRVLEPFLADVAPGRGRLWQGLTAAYLSIGAPEIDDVVLPAQPSWEEILVRACDSRNEHVIKLVDSCREEEAAYGDPRYRQVAARLALR